MLKTERSVFVRLLYTKCMKSKLEWILETQYLFGIQKDNFSKWVLKSKLLVFYNFWNQDTFVLISDTKVSLIKAHESSDFRGEIHQLKMSTILVFDWQFNSEELY